MSDVSLQKISEQLTDVSWDILYILDDKEHISFSELKKLLNISAQKLYIELALLKGGLLIQAKAAARDQRVLLYSISEHGKQIIKFKN